jgi:hypothetical protein
MVVRISRTLLPFKYELETGISLGRLGTVYRLP